MNEDKLWEEWENIGDYIWGNFRKEWPKFSFDEIEDLSYEVIENREVYDKPSEMEKGELLEVIKEYLNSHPGIYVASLLDDEKVEEDISWISEFDHYVSIYWEVAKDNVMLELIAGDDFDFKTLLFLDALEKRYGIEENALKLISSFRENTTYDEYSRLKFPINLEFQSLKKKWQPIFNEEVIKAKKILERIINGMFNQDGVLKKEVYKR